MADNKMSAAEFRAFLGKLKPLTPTNQELDQFKTALQKGKRDTEMRLVDKPTPGKTRLYPERMDAAEACMAMGAYFELDAKSVKFWIKQMELSRKL